MRRQSAALVSFWGSIQEEEEDAVMGCLDTEWRGATEADDAFPDDGVGVFQAHVHEARGWFFLEAVETPFPSAAMDMESESAFYFFAVAGELQGMEGNWGTGFALDEAKGCGDGFGEFLGLRDGCGGVVERENTAPDP